MGQLAYDSTVAKFTIAEFISLLPFFIIVHVVIGVREELKGAVLVSAVVI